jgi:hypothetical protein
MLFASRISSVDNTPFATEFKTVCLGEEFMVLLPHVSLITVVGFAGSVASIGAAIHAFIKWRRNKARRSRRRKSPQFRERSYTFIIRSETKDR